MKLQIRENVKKHITSKFRIILFFRTHEAQHFGLTNPRKKIGPTRPTNPREKLDPRTHLKIS